MAATAADVIRVIKPEQMTELTAQTSGMVRQELVSAPGTWIGITRAAPGLASGWHHHGDYDTYVYVLSGTARLEFGPAGREACDGEAGDLLVVPKGVVHREVSPAGVEAVALIVRVGSGDPVFNVDRPSA
ncbi:MAG: cupin domain-containing protein [Chloroflexota bacterium]